MRLILKCLPCLLRQIEEALEMSGAEDELKNEIFKKALETMTHYEDYPSSPHIAGYLHGMVREMTGCDPYYAVKEKDMETAKAIFPLVEEYISHKEDKLYWSLKASACGNALDAAANPGASFDESVAKELETPFGICDIELLREKLRTAKKVLILADNSGETYFDLLLIKALAPAQVIYAVRECPAINDATVDIAVRSGIEGHAKIISSGSRAPGTILEEATEEFMEIFNTADVIISKGQGNYESLDVSGREIFYLFKVKCPVISEHFGIELGKYVFKREQLV
ncbi:MAG: DUF89 family protein [Ruminococcaceae bacterium]|nr:DUF89 family protein [Oscillospiraceae bacterium]